MIRNLCAAGFGALFGLGLLVSGMTNPAKVRGFLDVFGQWDPTLGFVMGGAILPMTFAWRLTRNRRPVLGKSFPPAPAAVIDRWLIGGSVLFGLGWGLAGLCPGPAMAGLLISGSGFVTFVLAMIAGMIAARFIPR